MLINYLKTIFRTLWKNWGYALINIGGLTVGMTACVLLLLWVQDELSFDRFHSKAGRIFRVVHTNQPSGVPNSGYSAPAALAAFGKQEIPEISQRVRIRRNWDAYLFTYQDKKFTESKLVYVDGDLFTQFDFPFIAGNPKQPFPNTESIVITESVAKKYFGEQEAMGKVIQVDEKKNCMVSGVIADIPANSSIRYDFFFPMDKLIKEYQSNIYWKSLETDWGNFGFDTYFLLQPGASIEAVGKKLTHIYRDHQPYDPDGTITLRQLPDIHLIAADGNDRNLQMVQIFFIVSLVILLIACINYVNLTTARATQRAKEVGIRKIVGASKAQVFGQFLGESALTVCSAFVLAFFCIRLLIPAYNELSGKELILSLTDPTLITVVGITLLVTFLVAGIYPSVLLSSFQPLQVMKGKLLPGSSNATFRKILVVTQFTFSIALIISTFIIGSQLQYIRTKDLGYNKENVFTFGMRGDMQKRYESVRTELLRQPGIVDVTAGNGNLLGVNNSTGDTDWNGKEPKSIFLVNALAVEENFLDMFNLKLVQGKGFTGSKADSTHYILNETAIRQMGIKDPIGKRFKLWLTEGTIIGVVKDFHFHSVHSKIEPAVFLYQPQWHWQLQVKTRPGQENIAIAAAEKIWKEFNPAYPFEYTFLDETFDTLYKNDQRTGKLFNYFSVITIIISCLGLFGLAAYTAQQRTKEIGIRKVLGASVGNITLLLSSDFLKLVGIAFILASPLAWYLMHNWLENFAYRIDISLWVFVLSGLLALLIALGTVSYQSIKAALSNPVKSLRNE